MWPFDYFKKKSPTVPAVSPHVHPAQAAQHPERPWRYLSVPAVSKPRPEEEDNFIPTMVGGFLVGELLGSLTAPGTDMPSPAPASDDAGFQGFGGGESGGAGAGGGWDAPSSSDSSSASDSSSGDSSSSADGTSSDTSSFDGGSSSSGDF